jgi:pSer/pThr/pTyr-binding forkhead associated (FHA) protein
MLRLRHAGIGVQLDAKCDALSFGRDASNDLIVADRRASRNHARIERRVNHYFLVDQSTNGTYVTFDGELEFALKREEVPLRGRGRIAFGHSSRDASAEIVEFELDS